jgi:16S rRNA (cytosine967-C5)-methyltransferase
MKCAREHAFYALERSLTGGGYLKEYLQGAPPLAVEIACGVMRQKRVLNDFLQILGSTGLKRKERIILWIALYQRYFLSGVPAYALVNETVNLAKKRCHPTFVRFCNAFLRKLPETMEAKRLSYPDYLLERVDAKYLKVMNQPPIHFARQRHQNAYIRITDPRKYCTDPIYYIQNPTPWELLHTVADKAPRNILDLCAAPGGKTLALRDIFPKAEITCNDVNESRLQVLQENLQKYSLDCKTIVSDGTCLETSEKYDLIVVDAPCSNTGVLGKRPESRWRAETEQIEQLCSLQKALLLSAESLLAEGGEIWYMTCSILPEENEKLIESLPFTVKKTHTIYPDESGMDGGFIAQLTKTAL